MCDGYVSVHARDVLAACVAGPLIGCVHARLPRRVAFRRAWQPDLGREALLDHRPSVTNVWDLLVFVVLLLVVVPLGIYLPGDWAHHRGESIGGVATVTGLDRVRGGDVVVVEVRAGDGRVVAQGQAVNGEAVERVGASFPVEYLPPDSAGNTQVYVAGHDPFATNLVIFAVVAVAWCISVPFVAARAIRGVRRLRGRRRQPSRYVAGRGYVRD